MNVETHRPLLAACAAIALTAFMPALVIVAYALVAERSDDVWRFALALITLRQLTAFTISAQFHRGYAHDQVRFPLLVDLPMRVWNFFFMGSATVWAVMHRRHHAHADAPEDPHSPHNGSLASILAQTSTGYFDTAERLARDTTCDRYRVGLPTDAFERFTLWVSAKGVFFIVLSRIPPLLALLSVFGLLEGFLLMLGLVGSMWTATIFTINGLCHLVGYRTSPCKDRSTNILPVDIVGFGELLHHNHHAYPGRRNLAIMPWEFDVGYWILRAMKATRLATFPERT